MKRRNFLKLSLAAGASILVPSSYNYAAPLDPDTIDFSEENYSNNAAQTIILFLNGGASQLGGNLTNIDLIKQYSQNSYDSHFGIITPTANNCWEEAGGTYMEDLISDGDMTLYRSCYSLENERTNVKSHGICTEQIQKGVYDIDSGSGGIIANIATILLAKGMIDSNTLLPFITMDGESAYYQDRNTPLPGYLKPVGISEDFVNPYKRYGIRNLSYYYSEQEQEDPNYDETDENGGFDPQLLADMKAIAQRHNQNPKIKNAFTAQEQLARFIDTVSNSATPDLGEDAYYSNSYFARSLEAAIKMLDNNPETRIITMGSDGLGDWDTHSNAKDYEGQSSELFAALKSAMAHLKAIGKDGTINIMVFGEFGRNVNLNAANGWDHGNLQNFFVLGGKNYFNHQGIVGKTIAHGVEDGGRLWLKPDYDDYWFDPLSIAATLYKIYGIENPQVLTGGDYPPVNVVG